MLWGELLTWAFRGGARLRGVWIDEVGMSKIRRRPKVFGPWVKGIHDWTVEDAAAAAAQGWGIYDTGQVVVRRPGSGDRFLGEQRPFELYSSRANRDLVDDDEAVEHVRELVKRGDPLGVKAKAFLLKHSLAEHDEIFGSQGLPHLRGVRQKF